MWLSLIYIIDFKQVAITAKKPKLITSTHAEVPESTATQATSSEPPRQGSYAALAHGPDHKKQTGHLDAFSLQQKPLIQCPFHDPRVLPYLKTSFRLLDQS